MSHSGFIIAVKKAASV